MLEPLTRATAIIVDENDVGTYIDRAANLKAVITNDVIQINRKNKMPISYQFYGFMVQCLNELPKIKDRSDSFFRRQLFIPMTKCFTGKERKYIKNEYLHRKDVLQYVLHRVLNMDYDTLSEPEACKAAWLIIRNSTTLSVGSLMKSCLNLSGIWLRSLFCTTSLLLGLSGGIRVGICLIM